MAEITFVIDQTALDTVKNTKLTANFDEMEAALTESIAPYEKLIVSEDAITEAKNDRARINKTKGNIDSYRKLVKGIYTEPLKQFEEKCKALCAICDRGLQNIDHQLADFEERRKEEKRSLLEDYFQTVCEKMAYPEYLSFEDALHPKWENKGTSLDECKKYIDERTAKVDIEVKAIRNLHSEWETALLNEYQRTLDFFAVVALNDQLTQKAQQEAERKRKQLEEFNRINAEWERKEAERIRKLEEDQAWKVAISEAQKKATTEESNAAASDFEAELQKAIDADQVKTSRIISKFVGLFTIVGTTDELKEVEELLNRKGVQYDVAYTEMP